MKRAILWAMVVLAARLLVVGGVLALAGCAPPASRPSYSTLIQDRQPSVERARECHQRGLALIDQDRTSDAEKAFREALSLDPTYAAAHNNLGILLLDHHGRGYEAAIEFTLAARLAPAAPQPHVNLGRLYEAVQWHPAAIKEYACAWALDASDPQALGRLAALSIRTGRADQDVDAWLKRLAAQSEAEGWRQWAQLQITRRGSSRESR